LCAFIAVCAAMLVLRVREPNRPRKFTTPMPWVVGLAGIGGCLWLFASLPSKTQLYFVLWNLLGLVVYLVYSSRLAARTRAEREPIVNG
jgi:APA family basic amino acid/polyamine antiporter